MYRAEPSVTAVADGFVFEGAYRVAGPGWQPSEDWYHGVYAREEAARGLKRHRGNLSHHCGHRLVADLVTDMRQRGRRSWRPRGSRVAAELLSVIKQPAGTAAADQTADRARGRWAQMMADAAAKMDDIQAKIDKRTRQLDAKAAARDADWAEAAAADALDFAEWAVDNAPLAMLDAIDARAYADKLAKAASS